MYRHIFTVQGRGGFPVDMLRYDACFPADGDAVSGIDRYADDDRTLRTIKLVHYHDAKRWEPTTGRWQSFLWSVHNVESPVKVG